ncbi:MAG: STAS domain-containing protein [Pseudomonadota bacterium]|nr:STAS domain-containing protein [Pseudomonadota bacterium]
MELQARDHGDALVVTVIDDRIDAAVAIQFKDRMREISETPHQRVVVDMSRVDFLDSSGLGAVVSFMKYLGPERRLELAGLTPTVAKVFRLTRMDSVFTLHDSINGAVAPGATAA